MHIAHSRRTYDYRIQEAICESGERDLFPELNIPRSTTRSWIHRGVPDVVTCDLAVRDRAELVAEIHRYQQGTALLGAIVGLLIAYGQKLEFGETSIRSTTSGRSFAKISSMTDYAASL